MPAKPPQKTKACPTGGFSDVLEAFEGRTKIFSWEEKVYQGRGFLNLIFILEYTYVCHIDILTYNDYIMCVYI